MNALYYSLIVYFFYHLVAESDLLARPRGWLQRKAPRWISYPLSCPFCFTWWFTVVWTAILWWTMGTFVLYPDMLFVAPVINYLIGLVAGALKGPTKASPDPRAAIAAPEVAPWEVIVKPVPGDAPVKLSTILAAPTTDTIS